MSLPEDQLPGEEQSLLSYSQTFEHGNESSSSASASVSVMPVRLSADIDGPQPIGSTESFRSLTFVNGLALVIGLQIGSGLFSSPSAVVHDIDSAVKATLIWLAAGLLVWTGAACSIELASIVPSNGGIQEYLRHCYHDLCGFMAALTWVFVVKPSSLAIISIIFSEYLYGIFSSSTDLSFWTLKGTAIAAMAIITWMNCLGTSISAGVANTFLCLKLLGLLSIIIAGITIQTIRFVHTESGTKNRDHNQVPNKDLRTLADAMLAALWAYSGWETLGFVAGELKDPLRNIPRVLNGAMATVVMLFTLANVSYFIVLPLDIVQKSETIALDFGRTVFGQAGGLFYTIIVCLSCLGAMNVKIFTTGRLIQAASARRYLPGHLARSRSFRVPSEAMQHDHRQGHIAHSPKQQSHHVDNHENVPMNAMLLNLCLTTIYIIVGSFRSLILVTGLAEYVFCFAATAGVLVLRRRAYLQGARDISTTYRTFLVNPFIFCTATGIVLFRTILSHPILSLSFGIFCGALAVTFNLKFWKAFVETGRRTQ